MIGIVEKVLLGLLLAVLMTGMGATLTLGHFREVVRRPRGVVVGLLSQFGWMPLVAFGLSTALSLRPELALGLIIMGSTPGGTTSNLFTYYSRADLALSISMTVASTVVAVAVMPLLLFVYASRLTSSELALPLGNVVTTLAVVLVPVAIGMYVRRRSVPAARRVERAGSYSGIAVLVMLIVSSLVRNHEVLLSIPPAGYVAAFALGALGMALGYASSRLLALPVPARRAVAFETGIQNSPLAFAIIIASLPDAVAQKALWLPMLYALFVLMSATAVTLWLRRLPSREPQAAWP